MLYITPTPLGNLSDITLRTLDTLKSVNLIIAENPLHSRLLLKHFQIEDKQLIQFAEHNELKVLSHLVDLLKHEDACLISDAGTPGISDPGFRLVRACVEAGIPVSPLPGANAGIAALSASGLPTDRFLFVGFLPKTEPKVVQIMEQAKNTESTLIAYDSPQRIVKTLGYISKQTPQAKVVVAREITKLHEEFVRGTADEVLETLRKRDNIKGEITLLISLK